jgi:hypothetical protein
MYGAGHDHANTVCTATYYRHRVLDASYERQRKPRVLVVNDNAVKLKLMLNSRKKWNLTVLSAAEIGC